MWKEADVVVEASPAVDAAHVGLARQSSATMLGIAVLASQPGPAAHPGDGPHHDSASLPGDRAALPGRSKHGRRRGPGSVQSDAEPRADAVAVALGRARAKF